MKVPFDAKTGAELIGFIMDNDLEDYPVSVAFRDDEASPSTLSMITSFSINGHVIQLNEETFDTTVTHRRTRW